MELNKDRRQKLLFWRAWGIAAGVGTVVIAGLFLLRQDHGANPVSNSRDNRTPEVAPNRGTALINTVRLRSQVPVRSGSIQTPFLTGPIPEPVRDAVPVATPDRSRRGQPQLPDIGTIVSRDRPYILPGRIRINSLVIARFQQGKAVRLSPLRPKFDLTAYLSQELAGYSLADHDSTGPHGREIEKRQSTSFSRSAGLLVSYHAGRHWIIQSGLGLSRSVSVGNPGKVVAVKDNNGTVSYQIYTVTGYGYLPPGGTASIGDSATTGLVTGKLDYISLPLVLSRTWTIGRFSFLAGAGFTANLLTRATVQASLDGSTGPTQEKEVTQYGLRKVTYGFQVKGECRYQLARNYAATLMTTFKNSVGPVNIHTAYSTYPYNLGVGVGITRSF